MIPKDCKRLAEVDFPIAEVSRHAAREKAIRHGHPSTLHLWWARRPLASSRAVLLGLLWPDPCDPLCPPEFKDEARRRLPDVARCNPGKTDGELRQALLRFIADFANWDLAANPTYLAVSRALVKAAHAPTDGGVYEPPLVVDPFAGGGSIPLEALRLGCEAFASDLNPVACLILKVMLEDIPRHGPRLAEELRGVGAEIKKLAERELSDLYPPDPDGATPIAYLWARTVRCESPNCGAEIPLMRSFWLCKKTKRKWALRYRIVPDRNGPPSTEFETFAPESEKEIPPGTVTRAKATCVCCRAVLPPDRVRAQLAEQGGGANVAFDALGKRTGGARLMAVVTLRRGEAGRHYRIASLRDYDAIRTARARLANLSEQQDEVQAESLAPVPDEPTPQDGNGSVGGGFRTRKYGISTFGSLFTTRQALALATVARLTRGVPSSCSDAVRRCAALALTRCADYWSSLCSWHLTGEKVNHTYGRQALPMIWDFCEVVPFCDSSGNYTGALEWGARVAEIWPGSMVGQVQAADATEHPLPDQAAALWFTDPPYYDSVPYADLADFFVVWLKRALGEDPGLRRALDAHSGLSPKAQEAVRDEQEHLDGRPKKSTEWYEEKMHGAFAEGDRILHRSGVGSIVFAHKTTEGWEALLSGVIRAGWTITGSWPIATEMVARLRARDSAALATSVHLICRPRSGDARVGDWAEVLRELPKRVGDWMSRLGDEGVRGADLVFACIGPALEVFSRYTRVETADGRRVKLDEYLEKVWEAVGRSALAQVLGAPETGGRSGAAGAVEEDARLTALFLWTLQTTRGADVEPMEDERHDEHDESDQDDEDDEGDDDTRPNRARGFTLVFDVVRRFAQPLGIDLPKWDGRVIELKKGVVRLLPIAERAKRLFGEDGAQAVASRLEQEATLGPNPLQGLLFPDMASAGQSRGATTKGRGRRPVIDVSDESLSTTQEATTLDRLHAAMLLQAGGRTNALRALLKAEQDRGADFLRLANALSALYPKDSEEKRLLDAMLLAVPR